MGSKHIARTRTGSVQGLKKGTAPHAVTLDPAVEPMLRQHGIVHLHFEDGTTDWVHFGDALAMDLVRIDPLTGFPVVNRAKLTIRRDLNDIPDGIVHMNADGTGYVTVDGRTVGVTVPRKLLDDFNVKFDIQPYRPRAKWTAPKRLHMSAVKIAQYFPAALTDVTAAA